MPAELVFKNLLASSPPARRVVNAANKSPDPHPPENTKKTGKPIAQLPGFPVGNNYLLPPFFSMISSWIDFGTAE